jgi:hypothetical protein
VAFVLLDTVSATSGPENNIDYFQQLAKNTWQKKGRNLSTWSSQVIRRLSDLGSRYFSQNNFPGISVSGCFSGSPWEWR